MPTNHNKRTLDILEQMSGRTLTFANLLWSIRKGEELTLVEFAKLLGVSKQFLCDLEHGRRFVRPKMASLYARKLGYSEHQFVRLCLQDMVRRDGLDLLVDIKKAA